MKESELVCPHCGAKGTLRLLARTAAYFHINEDGSIGEVDVSKEHLKDMHSYAESAGDGEVSFWCDACWTTFQASSQLKFEENSTKYVWKIGEEWDE